MNEVVTTGVDLAKSVFQVCGVDAEGAVIVRRQLRRGPVLTFSRNGDLSPVPHGAPVPSAIFPRR
jgi:hypothetical protein